MKKFSTCILILVASGSVALGDGSLEDNREIISTIVETVGTNGINSFPDPAPILGLLETSAGFSQLAARASSTWHQSIENISVVAPDRASRLVLLHSFLYLPPQEYVTCLNRVLDLFEKQQLSRDEVVYIFVIPPRDENRWFLSFNSDEPQVRKLLDRVRTTFMSDKDIVSLVDLISSGKARTRDERLRTEQPSAAKRKVPKMSEP